jgi:hypothetical protein
MREGGYWRRARFIRLASSRDTSRETSTKYGGKKRMGALYLMH